MSSGTVRATIPQTAPGVPPACCPGPMPVALVAIRADCGRRIPGGSHAAAADTAAGAAPIAVPRGRAFHDIHTRDSIAARNGYSILSVRRH